MSPRTSAGTALTNAAYEAPIDKTQPARGLRLLQPQTLGSIIRNTVSIYVRNWITICLIYILPLLPIAALQGALEADGYKGWAAILLLIQFPLDIIVGVALIIAVSDICIGLVPNVRRAYRRGFANSGRLVMTYLLMMVLFLIGFMVLVVPGLVLAVWYMFALPAVVLENFRGRAALRRSRELGRGFCWRNFGIGLLGSIIAGIMVLVISFFVGILDHLTLGNSHPLLEAILGQTISIALFAPLSSIPLVLLYYDMRARKEGYGAAQLIEDLRI